MSAPAGIRRSGVAYERILTRCIPDSCNHRMPTRSLSYPWTFPCALAKSGGTVATIALVSAFVFGGVEVAHAGTILSPWPPSTRSEATNWALSSARQQNRARWPHHGHDDQRRGRQLRHIAGRPRMAGGSWILPKDYRESTRFSSEATSSPQRTARRRSRARHHHLRHGTPVPHQPAVRAPAFCRNIRCSSGTGPARGSITVVANAGGPVCTVALVPDSGSGAVTRPRPARWRQRIHGQELHARIGRATRALGDQCHCPGDGVESTPPAMTYTMGYATGRRLHTTSFENAADRNRSLLDHGACR